DADRRDTGGLVVANGADDVDRVPEAVVAVRDDRDLGRVRHLAGRLERLGLRQDVRVRDTASGGDLEAARPDGVEPRLLDEPCRESRVSSGDDDRTIALEKSAKKLGLFQDEPPTQRDRNGGEKLAKGTPHLNLARKEV